MAWFCRAGVSFDRNRLGLGKHFGHENMDYGGSHGTWRQSSRIMKDLEQKWDGL